MQQYSARAIMWMTYLQYLPNKNEDQQVLFLGQQHDLYKSYIEEFTQKEHFLIFQSLDNMDNCQNSISFHEFLDFKKGVVNAVLDEKRFFQDEQLYENIEKDMPRSLTKYYMSNDEEQANNQNFHYFFFTDSYKRRKSANNLQIKHEDIIGRILYIYGKLNPIIGYMQGMSDLLLPLYLILKNEADTFFCFTKMMAQIKDAYISDFDYTTTGIRGLLQKFQQIFKQKEPILFNYLLQLGIHPYMYGYRWIITLLTREFSLEQINQIWDFMLQVDDIHTFVIKLAISILISLKSQLMQANFKMAFDILFNSEKDIKQILEILLNKKTWARCSF